MFEEALQGFFKTLLLRQTFSFFQLTKRRRIAKFQHWTFFHFLASRAAVEHMPRDLEVLGSNPARYLGIRPLSIVWVMCQFPQSVASLLSFSTKNGFPAALHLIRVYLPWPKRISLFWCYTCRYDLGQCCSWWLKWSSPVERQTCLPLQPYHLKQKGLKGQYEKNSAHHLVDSFC